MSDEEIIESLKELDGDEDTNVTSWEADFIESVVFRNPRGTLTEGQRDKAIQILDQYGF